MDILSFGYTLVFRLRHGLQTTLFWLLEDGDQIAVMVHDRSWT